MIKRRQNIDTHNHPRNGAAYRVHNTRLTWLRKNGKPHRPPSRRQPLGPGACGQEEEAAETREDSPRITYTALVCLPVRLSVYRRRDKSSTSPSAIVSKYITRRYAVYTRIVQRARANMRSRDNGTRVFLGHIKFRLYSIYYLFTCVLPVHVHI